MGLLRFIIISLCIYYIIKTLSKIFLPILFKNAVNKMQNQASSTAEPIKPAGTISVDYIPPSPKKETKANKQDEFIDFEEVK